MPGESGGLAGSLESGNDEDEGDGAVGESVPDGDDIDFFAVALGASFVSAPCASGQSQHAVRTNLTNSFVAAMDSPAPFST